MQGLLWTQRIATGDIDHLARAQPGWSLRYEQLSPGRWRGECRLAQLPGLRLVHEQHSCAVRQQGRLGDQVYGFALALPDCSHAHFAGQRVPCDTLMMGRGDDIDLCTPAGGGFIAIVVERELLEPLWRELYGKPLAGWLERPVIAAARSGQAEHLRAVHLGAMDRLHAWLCPDAATLLPQRDFLLLEWLATIPPQVGVSAGSTPTARRHLVARACEATRSSIDVPLSVPELCRRIGTSPRKLAYCFADVLGTSPARYLRALRLNAARSALRRAAAAGDSGVQDIAARHGFWHFAQFASDYRRLFGERPSQTLQAARDG